MIEEDGKMVFWNTRKLSREFNISPQKVARILKSIGALRWSKSNQDGGSNWYWEELK